jgi:hypothetical protein
MMPVRWLTKRSRTRYQRAMFLRGFALGILASTHAALALVRNSRD